MNELLDNLANRNSAIMRDLFGKDFTDRSARDCLPTAEVVEVNERLGEYLYGPEVASKVQRGQTEALSTMHRDILAKFGDKESLATELELRKLGVVVVRPELFGMRDQVRQFLEASGLRVVLSKTTQIDFESYWALYGPGLADPEAKHDFPTRTLNYINQDIELFVVGSADPHFELDTSVSQDITERLKGSQGVYQPGTLRGDIALTALKGYIRLDGTGFVDSQSTIALDPIGAYRALVRGEVVSDRSHATADSPLLFYGGQSIHVPDDSELARDLSVLLSENDFDTIAKRIQND